MSKKRSSAESNEDDQTNEGSESFEQRKDNNKRARFDSVSDTTLQDLPIELLECILFKVVAMEVKGLRLVKSVWEEKADQVISRLRTVCSQWNNILTTNYFRKKLHRTLGAALETKIRLEILHETPIGTEVLLLTTLKNEVFMLSCVDQTNQLHIIEVYNRSNMSEVKDVIPLPGSTVHRMRGCNVSNCVYVLIQINNVMSFLRIYKDTEDTFNVVPWEYDHKLPISTFSVSANGNLLILSSQQRWWYPHFFVSVYDANSFLQHTIKLPTDIDALRYQDVMQNSNGNLVVSYVSRANNRARLLEIDTTGSVVRQCKTSVRYLYGLHFADIYGRIVLTKPFKGMKLLDSELNLLGAYSLQQDDSMTRYVFDSHYNSERSEIVRIHYDENAQTRVLAIFRFTEE